MCTANSSNCWELLLDNAKDNQQPSILIMNEGSTTSPLGVSNKHMIAETARIYKIDCDIVCSVVKITAAGQLNVHGIETCDSI